MLTELVDWYSQSKNRAQTHETLLPLPENFLKYCSITEYVPPLDKRKQNKDI